MQQHQDCYWVIIQNQIGDYSLMTRDSELDKYQAVAELNSNFRKVIEGYFRYSGNTQFEKAVGAVREHLKTLKDAPEQLLIEAMINENLG